MNSLVIKQGVKIIRTPEQIAEMETWKTMTDDDIDFSDIPEITHEEFVRAIERKRAKQKSLQAAG